MSIDLDYLKRLVADKEAESFELEFKDSASLQTEKTQRASGNREPKNYVVELSRDVSAMANANGGRIIYGIHEKHSRADKLDLGSPMSEKKADWIDQSCANHIHPRLEGIRITPILAENGNEYFVVDVPKATVFAPHQAGDKVYYQRQNTTILPLEDYQIRDLRSRAVSPHLILVITTDFISMQTVDGEKIVSILLRGSIRSLTDTIVLYSVIRFYLDERLEILNNAWAKGPTAPFHYVPTGATPLVLTDCPCVYYTKPLSVNKNDMPIFQGIEFEVLNVNIKARIPANIEPTSMIAFLYGWTIVAPGATKKSRLGLLLIGEDSVRVGNEIDIQVA